MLRGGSEIQADGTAARWRAVAARDRRADGLFVYAVRSTGIYCRPSCPSRRPRRDRAVFFATAAAAEAAGYRACRRCHPRLPTDVDPWPDRIERACAYLAAAGRTVPLARLARHVGVSPFHLQRNFKRIVGVTPREYAAAGRLRHVRSSLRHGRDVTEALIGAGYSSSSRFYEHAAPLLGMPPATYRRGGAGLSITYATTACPLGRLLVAATPRGVCAVSLGASDAALTRALAREFPAATLAADASGALTTSTRAVLAHIEGPARDIPLRLDIRATAFEWRVWNELAAIPFGETRTYSQVAAAIGRPSAARAVARACAANRTALVVPCHRVVPAAGGTGGYRWGVGRKRALLAREAAGGRMPGR